LLRAARHTEADGTIRGVTERQEAWQRMVMPRCYDGERRHKEIQPHEGARLASVHGIVVTLPYGHYGDDEAVVMTGEARYTLLR